MKTAWALFVLLISSVTAWAGPQVQVVIGEKAPALERAAADELAALLKRTYDATVTIGVALPKQHEHVIYVVGPQPNPQLDPVVKDFLKRRHGDVTEQTHYVMSLFSSDFKDDRSRLILGGGSPAATYWAVAEFAHHLGQRSLLFGDLSPVAPPAFSLAGIGIFITPEVSDREWCFDLQRPFAAGAADLDEIRTTLRQLAKLRFNRVRLTFEGTTIEAIWGGRQIPVSGDTSGRKGFGGKKVFENAAFAGANSPAAKSDALIKWVRGIASAGRDFGITVVLDGPANRWPKELAEFVDPATGSSNSAVQTYELNPPDGLLPFMRHAQWPTKWTAETNAQRQRISVRNSCLGDADFSAYSISRAALGAPLPIADQLQNLLTPVCGAEVDTRVAKAFELVTHATNLLESANDGAGLANAIVAELEAPTAKAVPAVWGEARTDFLNAMNEMYRANTRAREGSRAYTLYFARRFEFAFEYMNCLEAVRQARKAELAKDTAAQITELEKAIESLNNSLNALAAIARSSSDRGVIATLNEAAYRPLQKKLAAADAQ